MHDFFLHAIFFFPFFTMDFPRIINCFPYFTFLIVIAPKKKICQIFMCMLASHFVSLCFLK
jgi:phenolic acid decarboxylase